MIQRRFNKAFTLLGLLLLAAVVGNLALGSVAIPLADTLAILFGGNPEKSTWEFIIWDYRLPKTITAVLTGSGLAVSGLIMQTLFRNPLAGPFVLGLSSGASLGVALLILGAGALGGLIGNFLVDPWSLVIASALGSFLVLLAVVAVSLRVKDTMALLIIGLMFGSLTAAVVAVLSYFSNAEQLQQYIFWSFGSLGNQSWAGIGILALCVVPGLIITFTRSKSLNALLLGEPYAQSMGLNLRKTSLILIGLTSLLAGSITAFAGPIAFVGLAIPHITRQWFPTSDHRLLIPAVILVGALVMLVCDTIAQWPFSAYTLPINAITSLFGAPVVIWLLVRKRKLLF